MLFLQHSRINTIRHKWKAVLRQSSDRTLKEFVFRSNGRNKKLRSTPRYMDTTLLKSVI